MEHGWAQEHDLLTSRDVLVIDEASARGGSTIDSGVQSSMTIGQLRQRIDNRRFDAPAGAVRNLI